MLNRRIRLRLPGRYGTLFLHGITRVSQVYRRSFCGAGCVWDGGQKVYWANTSSNSLVGKLIRQGSPEVKMTMELLLEDRIFQTEIDEQIVFDQLDYSKSAIWDLLLVSGYLRVNSSTKWPGKICSGLSG